VWFDLNTPVADLGGLGGYTRAHVLVRVSQQPVGWVELPLVEGRCSRSVLTRAILDQHERQIVRRLVIDALNGGGDWAFPEHPAGPPSLTVAVCTRNRPDDLAECLRSLLALEYPRLELLVVDNAPSDGRTEQVVRGCAGRVRYLREERPGLSWARRCAVDATASEIVAFIDDDVRVDADWARATAQVFAEAPDVMCVLGLVAPMQMEAEAQERFEQHGGFGRGMERRWLRRRADEHAAPSLANTGTFGTGANMAFRRVVFAEIGGFDPALGAGSLSDGGEDLDMIFRVLHAGHTVVYEPASIVWHRHRLEMRELAQQTTSWGRGMFAYLTRSWRFFPSERRGLARLAAGLLLIYFPRRMVQALFDSRLRLSLVAAEFAGALGGPWRYRQASRAARRQETPADAVSAPPGAMPVALAPSPVGIVDVDLELPLPAVFTNPERADVLQLEVTRAGGPVGRVTIVCGGYPVSRGRVVDAIVAQFDTDVLDASGAIGRRVRQALASEPARDLER